MVMKPKDVALDQLLLETIEARRMLEDADPQPKDRNPIDGVRPVITRTIATKTVTANRSALKDAVDSYNATKSLANYKAVMCAVDSYNAAHGLADSNAVIYAFASHNSTKNMKTEDPVAKAASEVPMKAKSLPMSPCPIWNGVIPREGLILDLSKPPSCKPSVNTSLQYV